MTLCPLTVTISVLIDKYSNKQLHVVKQLNIRRSKISLGKNQDPLKEPRQKVKSRVGTQTLIADKKTMTTSMNTKTEH